MIIKKLLSIVAAATMAITSLTGAMYVSAIDTDNYFQYVKFPDFYQATFKNGVDLSGVSELDIPENFDDGTGILPVALDTLGNNNSGNVIQTVKTASPVLSISSAAFSGLNSLVKVEYSYKDTLTIKHRTFESCSTTLKEINIYASSVVFDGRFAPRAFETFKDIPDAKIHVVKDSGVKQQIVDGTKDGSAPVPESMIIEDLTDSRKASSIEINCDNINYGTKSGFKPTFKVKVGEADRTDLAEKVTYGLYASETGGSDLSKREDFSTLAVGHYWIKASLDGTDEYKGSTAVKEVQVVDPNAAMKLGLDALIKQADEIKSHQSDYYNSAAFLFTDKVIDTDGDQENDMSLYDYAKKVYNDPAAKSTDVTNAMTKLSDALNSDNLVLNSDLASPKERKSFVTDVRNKYINETEADYTAESWKNSGFGELLNELNTKYTTDYVSSGPVTSEELSNFKTSIEEAIGKLVKRTDFDEYFSELEKAMTNAKAILDDNPNAKYADSQIETLQAAYDAAEKILEDKESVANRAVIINTTTDVNNAINGLVEVDRTELLSKLQDAIKEAEAMDSEKENYTAESYKVLTDAIEAAKGITEDSTVTEMQTALDNINSAISGLKKDSDAIQAAKDELSKAVEEAEAIDSSKYTEESYAKVADTINEAKRLIARQNVNLTVSGLKAAQAALEEAIKGLKEKQPEGPGNQKPSGNNNNNNGSNNIKKPPVNNKVVVKTTSREDAVKAAKAKAKSQMKQAKIKKLKVKSKAKKTIKVTWKKVKKAKGYRVQVSTNRKFKKSKIIFEKHTKKKTLKITKKIKSGKTYYIRVSAYTTYKDINGKTQKVYSKNKPFKKVKVK